MLIWTFQIRWLKSSFFNKTSLWDKTLLTSIVALNGGPQIKVSFQIFNFQMVIEIDMTFF